MPSGNKPLLEPMLTQIYVTICHVTRQPSLWLFSWSLVIQTSLCNSFENQATIDEIYGCQSSNKLQWLELIGHQHGSASNGHQSNMPNYNCTTTQCMHTSVKHTKRSTCVWCHLFQMYQHFKEMLYMLLICIQQRNTHKPTENATKKITMFSFTFTLTLVG